MNYLLIIQSIKSTILLIYVKYYSQKKNNNGDKNQKKTGRTPVVALIARNIPSKQQPIQHVIVKRTVSVEKKLRFEIDHYDLCNISWSWATDKSKNFIWKTNLLGGGRLFQIIYKLSLLPTLEDFIKDLKEENPKWQYSSGYKIGGITTKKYPADYLHLKPTIDTTVKFDHNTQTYKTTTEVAIEFEAPRNSELYQSPLLVISEVINDKGIPMQIFDHYQPFNISFIGIHAPIGQRHILENIYNRFYENVELRRIYHMYMLVTSSKLLIHKETAFVKADLDHLPFPEDASMLKLNEEELLIVGDVLDYYMHLGKAISSRSAGHLLIKTTSKDQLQNFGKVFCKSLNSLYEDNGKSWQIGWIYHTKPYVVYQFGFGNSGELQESLQKISADKITLLIENKLSNSGALYKRLVRIYQHVNGFDCLFLIKPNNQRYWLNSIALKDSDDTFSELKKAGF